MKKIILFLSAPFFYISANAYIPPPSFVVSQMLEKHSGMKTILFDGRIHDPRTGKFFIETCLIDFNSGKVISKYTSETGEGLGTFTTSLRDIHRLGKVWINLSLDPHPARFREAIQELNLALVEKGDAKLARDHGRVTWVIGSGPYLRVVKDQFVPSSYETDERTLSSQSLFITDWVNVGSEWKIPKKVELQIDGKSYFTYENKSVKVNVNAKLNADGVTIESASVKDWVTLVR